MEEAVENYASTGEVLPNGKVMIDFQAEKAFRAGAKWQKEQMMKKAVEGVVKESYAERLVVESRYIYKDEIDELDIKRGDKVKLIIVREEQI